MCSKEKSFLKVNIKIPTSLAAMVGGSDLFGYLESLKFINIEVKPGDMISKKNDLFMFSLQTKFCCFLLSSVHNRRVITKVAV